MIIGIPAEIKSAEKRVAMSPANVQSLTDKGVKVLFQTNAGDAAGYPDGLYTEAGATISADRAEIFAQADIILQVQSFGSNNENSEADLASLRSGQLVIGMMDPLASPECCSGRGRKRRDSHCPGIGTAHQSRSEYGCTFIHGHIGRLQSRVDGSLCRVHEYFPC